MNNVTVLTFGLDEKASYPTRNDLMIFTLPASDIRQIAKIAILIFARWELARIAVTKSVILMLCAFYEEIGYRNSITNCF